MTNRANCFVLNTTVSLAPFVQMKTVVMEIWLKAEVLAEINPFAVTDNKLAFPPLKRWVVRFDAWDDRLKCNRCELLCSGL